MSFANPNCSFQVSAATCSGTKHIQPFEENIIAFNGMKRKLEINDPLYMVLRAWSSRFATTKPIHARAKSEPRTRSKTSDVSNVPSHNFQPDQETASFALHINLVSMILIRYFLLAGLLASFATAGEEPSEGYGLDCSWPIHNLESSCGNLLGDRKTVHEEYIRGCGEKYGAKGVARCAQGDKDRLEMSRRQPQSMVVRAEMR